MQIICCGCHKVQAFACSQPGGHIIISFSGRNEVLGMRLIGGLCVLCSVLGSAVCCFVRNTVAEALFAL